MENSSDVDKRRRFNAVGKREGLFILSEKEERKKKKNLLSPANLSFLHLIPTLSVCILCKLSLSLVIYFDLFFSLLCCFYYFRFRSLKSLLISHIVINQGLSLNFKRFVILEKLALIADHEAIFHC